MNYSKNIQKKVEKREEEEKKKGILLPISSPASAPEHAETNNDKRGLWGGVGVGLSSLWYPPEAAEIPYDWGRMCCVVTLGNGDTATHKSSNGRV